MMSSGKLGGSTHEQANIVKMQQSTNSYYFDGGNGMAGVGNGIAAVLKYNRGVVGCCSDGGFLNGEVQWWRCVSHLALFTVHA
jgi:hypothetical protein